jgi:hypothetical protein
LARALKYVIHLSVVGTIYFFLVQFALELALAHLGATAIWPPTAFALLRQHGLSSASQV